MSITFTLFTSDAPDLRSALGALPFSDLELGGPAGKHAVWPVGTTMQLFRRGISCRSIELTRQHDQLEVRCFMASSTDDWSLAAALVAELARRHRTEVHSETGEVLPVDSVRTSVLAYAAPERDAHTVAQLLQSGQAAGPLEFPGPGRSFFVGTRLLAQLRPDAEGYADRFYDTMRRVRWFDPDGQWFRASTFEVSSETVDPRTLAVLGPGVATVMPRVQIHALFGDGDDLLMLPADVLPTLVPVGWLDERQFTVDALDDEAWQALLARAEPHRVEVEEVE